MLMKHQIKRVNIKFNEFRVMKGYKGELNATPPAFVMVHLGKPKETVPANSEEHSGGYTPFRCGGDSQAVLNSSLKEA